jgi:hypothetical protein
MSRATLKILAQNICDSLFKKREKEINKTKKNPQDPYPYRRPL